MSHDEFEAALPAIRSMVLERIKHYDAEDIFQEVSFRAYGKLEDFINASALESYCYAGVAQELRRDISRASERRAALGLHQITGNTTDAPSTNRIEAERAIQELPEHQRKAAREMLVEGASTREVDLPRETARRLKKKLQARLEEAA